MAPCSPNPFTLPIPLLSYPLALFPPPCLLRSPLHRNWQLPRTLFRCRNCVGWASVAELQSHRQTLALGLTERPNENIIPSHWEHYLIPLRTSSHLIPLRTSSHPIPWRTSSHPIPLRTSSHLIPWRTSSHLISVSPLFSAPSVLSLSARRPS